MVAKIPTFLEKTGYRNPTDAYNSPFQLTMGTDLLYWDWLKTRPRDQEAFNITMSLNRATRGINCKFMLKSMAMSFLPYQRCRC